MTPPVSIADGSALKRTVPERRRGGYRQKFLPCRADALGADRPAARLTWPPGKAWRRCSLVRLMLRGRRDGLGALLEKLSFRHFRHLFDLCRDGKVIRVAKDPKCLDQMLMRDFEYGTFVRLLRHARVSPFTVPFLPHVCLSRRRYPALNSPQSDLDARSCEKNAFLTIVLHIKFYIEHDRDKCEAKCVVKLRQGVLLWPRFRQLLLMQPIFEATLVIQHNSTCSLQSLVPREWLCLQRSQTSRLGEYASSVTSHCE